jgi:hypothetical protein
MVFIMETWKPVPGFEDSYIVSDGGRVARLIGSTTPSHRYTRVNLRGLAGKARSAMAHALVLEAFVGPRPPGAVARHLNDVPDDNRLENLEWGTSAQNTEDAFANGGRKLKETCPLGHPITGPNLQAKGRRCKACNQARAHAHYQGIEFSKEAADKRFEEVMQRWG